METTLNMIQRKIPALVIRGIRLIPVAPLVSPWTGCAMRSLAVRVIIIIQTAVVIVMTGTRFKMGNVN